MGNPHGAETKFGLPLLMVILMELSIAYVGQALLYVVQRSLCTGQPLRLTYSLRIKNAVSGHGMFYLICRYRVDIF